MDESTLFKFGKWVGYGPLQGSTHGWKLSSERGVVWVTWPFWKF